MALENVAYRRAEDISSDHRWAAWVAKGVAHDRTFQKRAIATAAALVAGLALWFVILLLR
jgi:hypothetical protein